MADRLNNGYGFGQSFGGNGMDGNAIGGMPGVDGAQQWAQFSQNHTMNPNMNPQMAQLLSQRNNAAGAQMQANNFQQHGFLEQQFGGTGGLLGNGTMNAMQAQQFSNAARGQPQPHQAFLPPNNDMVRQMGLLQSQNNPLHQQQAATMQLLNQRLGAGHPGQPPHPGQHPGQQPQQQPGQAPNGANRNVLLALVQGIGQPQQTRLTQQIMQNLPRMSAEELVTLARQGRSIEADLQSRGVELQTMARNGANTIQIAQQAQEIQKKIQFVGGFGIKINQEILARKDKGQFPIHLLQNLPPPQGPLPRTLANGMTNPDWLKAHGAPPDLFTNGAYPQHEVQAAVERMRQTIINQGGGQQQLAQLQALQQQHANAVGQRAPSRQQNPATPGLTHASPMPQPANVNPQQAPPQQPGGGGPINPADVAQRLRNLPHCDQVVFQQMWPAWVKNTGLSLTMDDVHPPETLQGKPSIPLWRLHAAVWQLGGHDNVGERWAQLAGRLGWGFMQDSAAGSLAPPMAAERLRQVHATHLKEFDKWYLNIQRQKLLQHMQNVGNQQQGGAARLAPDKIQQAIQAAIMNVSADELRGRNVGEDVIAFVEANREALIQKHHQQTAFKNGLTAQAQQPQPPQMHPQPHPGPPMNGNVGGQGQGQVPAQVGQAPTPEQRQALAQRTLQLFGPLPAARDLKGVRPDGNIDPGMMNIAIQTVAKMKKSVEPQLQAMIKPIEPPVDVDRIEWMALMERGSGLAGDIEKVMPHFIAYTQSPGNHLAQILTKYVGQIMTITFQKKLLGERPPRFIIDLNTLRGFIQQFSNLLVILRNRVQAVRIEFQQMHPNGQLHRPPSQQGGPPPPPPGHMGVGIPGQQQQQQLNVPNVGRVPTPHNRVPTPQQMAAAANGRVTPAQFPPTPVMNSAEVMPPPPQPPAAAQHKRKPSDMQSPAAGSPHTPAPANAASPQTPQTPKTKPKPKPKNPRRKSIASTTPVVADGEKDAKDAKDSAATAATAAPEASTSTIKPGNKRPREEDPVVPAASPKRAKADWEGAPSDSQERRAKEAEEAPKDDASTAQFVDNMMKEFESFQGDATPFVSGINAILAAMPAGEDGVGGSGKEDGLDEFLDFSQFINDAAFGTGTGTVGATPELVHGSSANPSPESETESGAAAAANGVPPSNASEKTPALGLGDTGLFGSFDDPLHMGIWGEVDGGETNYYHGGAGWKWDAPMPSNEQPWAISTS